MPSDNEATTMDGVKEDELPSAPPRRKSIKGKTVRAVSVINNKKDIIKVSKESGVEKKFKESIVEKKPPVKPTPPTSIKSNGVMKQLPTRPPGPKIQEGNATMNGSKPKPIPRPRVPRPTPAPRKPSSKSFSLFEEQKRTNIVVDSDDANDDFICEDNMYSDGIHSNEKEEKTKALSFTLPREEQTLVSGSTETNGTIDKENSHKSAKSFKNAQNIKPKTPLTVQSPTKQHFKPTYENVHPKPYENISFKNHHNNNLMWSNRIQSNGNLDTPTIYTDNITNNKDNFAYNGGFPPSIAPDIYSSPQSVVTNNDYNKFVSNHATDLDEGIYSAPTPHMQNKEHDSTLSTQVADIDDGIYSSPQSLHLNEHLNSSGSHITDADEEIYSSPTSYNHTNDANKTLTRDHQIGIVESEYSVPVPLSPAVISPFDEENYSIPSPSLKTLHNVEIANSLNEDKYVDMTACTTDTIYEDVSGVNETATKTLPLRPPPPYTKSKTVSGDKTKEEMSDERRVEYLSSDSDSDSEYSSSDDENGFKTKSKLFNIAYEILSTEKTFVEALELIYEDFQVPLKAAIAKNPRLLPEGDYEKIFMNIELIYELDKKFLNDLEERMENWEQYKRIGDIIREYGHFLKLYSTYINGYDNAMVVYRESIGNNLKFSQLVKDFEKSKKAKNLMLTSYLLKPIQRIPSYRLLLKDYLKHLPEDSPDYKDIKDSVTIVSDVANHINESMKEGEKFQEVLRIQSKFVNTNDIIKPGRFLLREGTLLKLSRKVLQERTFILFNDALLYCTNYGNGQLKLLLELPLAGMTVQYPDSQELSKEFSVISTKRSFLLNASSPKEKEDWVAALENAVNVVNAKIETLKRDPEDALSLHNVSEIGSIAPQWIPDSRVTMCQMCTSFFNVYHRRHHCRACGKVVCGECSSFEAPLKYMDNEVARVCEKCYQSLKDKVQGDDGLILKFKEMGGRKTKKRDLPSTLTEVGAQDEGIENSGFLRLKKDNKKEKRYWFVLKDNVLYLYKASSDPAASSTIPVLGYNLEITGNWDEEEFIFQLIHPGVKNPLVFRAENRGSAERWVHCFCKATAITRHI